MKQPDPPDPPDPPGEAAVVKVTLHGSTSLFPAPSSTVTPNVAV